MKNKGLLVILFITVLALIMSSCSGGGGKSVLVTATIEASPKIGGNVSFDGTTWLEATSTTVNEGTEVEIHVQTDEKYIFEGWYEGDTYKSKDNPHTVRVNSDRTITAEFKAKEYGVPTITLIAPETGIKEVDPQTPPTLEWQAQAGEQINSQTREEPTLSKYEICLGTNPTPTTLVNTIDDPSNTQWQITTDLTYGQTYYWKVKAYQSDGKSGTSGTRRFSTVNQYTLTIISSPSNTGNVKLNNGDWTKQSSDYPEKTKDNN